MSSQIHPTAIVHPGAKLGVDVEVGPYSIVGSDVEVGDRCRIGPHVVIDGRTSLGEECVVFQFASVGSAPQDLKYKGEPSRLIIGNRNQIREYVTLNPGTAHGHMQTCVGDNNLFMACSHVAHDCIVGNGNVFANGVAIAGHVTIGNRVILGGMAGVHQFVRVGDYAILGAGAMVGQDVPPYCIGQGDRCTLRGINLVGLRRGEFSREDIGQIKQAYGLLFSTYGDLKRKISEFPAELSQCPAVRFMLDFILGSERGVCSALKARGAADSQE